MNYSDTDIRKHRHTDGKPNLRRFHQARWDEPVVMELSAEGERGILIPEAEQAVRDAAANVYDTLPSSMRRKNAPALPEIAQNRVLRHYLRLSQENLGADLQVDIGQGTCTMKYNPKINDQLAYSPKMAELHPLQDESTVQGILEVMHEFEKIIKAISGMDKASFQPRGGSAAIYANAAVIKKYHDAQGNTHKDEIITTMLSHPSDAACAKLFGFKIITLYPDDDGYPDIEALKAAVSERTAGLMITNPEDTGIFNPRIQEFVDIVHEVGGLCAYDQANANGLLGITRARDAGFDLCQFNLHKTFSTPHNSGGPAVGVQAVTKELVPYLPGPLVENDNGRYYLNDDLPHGIGKVAAFYGAASVVLRAYAWVMNLGAEGLKEVAEIAVLNNNYLMGEVLKIKGSSAPWAKGKRRIEQVRYSWEELHRDTGIHSEQLGLRMADYGLHYWTSHHPYLLPEPATFEPTESYSITDMDEYVRTLKAVTEEAYSNPAIVRSAPHNCPIHKIRHDNFDDPERWAVTWRAYCRKHADSSNG
ncbi:aminomethyl-transferring glycine dehydrogenase subunit GcvPB [Parendozoicomonas haliclonae]|uniref:Putative glycine dehydrogenase (Decarboxylating) subunit 2 n=1 Tax=Parendozoicomonas haliclonae TaxID=1960125 RepID=A0A1X7AH75_9GAMM|nr:aminomethyl-transferring glycine dehydrogenase subunit GcvPB [Parendozoicomonas haliclonae]SMA40362.1 putative glycine dehydrogenase (decarboxylating) subunit 2 [Parendozoicomonas haliclonae]